MTQEPQLPRLTQTVQKGGCAAKIAAGELHSLLNLVRFPTRPQELLIDGSTFDDAAVYRLSPEQALVQTVDFFTPIVDSPDWFGKIAAANALSDVYAMGGKPVTCLAILAYPLAQFATALMKEVMQGACDVIEEAKACLVGGHSIDDDTLKFGFAVTGFVHPQKIWANTGAKVGDALILTKPLGTGTLTAALKKNVVVEQDLSEVLQSMAQLNNVIEKISESERQMIHGATDITGFGFIGHSVQMAEMSGVSFEVFCEKIPVFKNVFESMKDGHLTKAHRTNFNQNLEKVAWDCDDFSTYQNLMSDPQTSGGLLLSVHPEGALDLLATLKMSFVHAEIIGHVEQRSRMKVTFS